MGLDFRPLIIEDTGALHQGTIDFISMATANSFAPLDSMSDYTKLTNAIAVAVARSTGDKFAAAKSAFKYKGRNTFFFPGSDSDVDG